MLPGNILVAVCADGAGSAEHSGRGAARAVETVIATAEAGLAGGPPTDEAGWTALIGDCFAAARASVLQLAESESLPARAFACTLLYALAADHWVAAGQVGDGIVIAAEQSLYTALTQPQHGEFANETFFITMDDVQPQVNIVSNHIEALALTTDGLTRLALEKGNQPHAPFFKPLFDFAAQAGDEAAQQLTGFLNSERVCDRTDDDKTLVLAVRAAQ